MRLSNALASDYSDDWGLDKSTLLGAVHSYRTQYDPIFIHISDLTVTVDPDHQKAQAVFIAKIIAKARGSVSDSEVREDRFRLYFRKNDSRLGADSGRIPRVEIRLKRERPSATLGRLWPKFNGP